MKASSTLILSFVIGSLVSACANKATGHRTADSLKPRYFFDAVVGNDSYSEVFDEHTQVDRVHSEFQPVIQAHATFLNSTFREAYIREFSGRYRLTAEEEKTLATEQLAEDEAYVVFVISAATREQEWNDLDRKNGLWRISLESPDGRMQILPERVQVVSNRDEKARYFYKYMDSFTRTYRVRFEREKVKDLKDMRLHISSGRGDVSFAFTNDRVGAQTR